MVRVVIPPGEKLIPLDCGDLTRLFYYDPSHQYLVGPQPMVLQVRNWRTPFNQTNWLVLRPFRRPAAEEAGLSPVFADSGGSVYRLK